MNAKTPKGTAAGQGKRARKAPQPITRGELRSLRVSDLASLRSHWDPDGDVVEPPSRHKFFEPERPGDGGIRVWRLEDGRYRGQVQLQLTTISSASIGESIARHKEGKGVDAGESTRQRATRALIAALRPGQSIRIEHSTSTHAPGYRSFATRVLGSTEASSEEEAVSRTRALLADCTTALQTGAPQFGFHAAPRPAEPVASPESHRLVLRPAAIEVTHRDGTSVGFGADVRPGKQVLLPLLPRSHQSFLDIVVPALMATTCDVVFAIDIAGRSWEPLSMQTVWSAATHVARGNLQDVRTTGRAPQELELGKEELEAYRSALSGWMSQPHCVDMRVTLSANEPISTALAEMLGGEVLQGRPFTIEDALSTGSPPAALDISAVIWPSSLMPPLLPDPLTLDKIGFRRHFPSAMPQLAADGIVLGVIPRPGFDQEVRFSAADRAQHCYIVGSTGTGKSTLLRGMITQDIEQGRGVALLDPHGDLYQRVLLAVPERRRGDVVLLDFTDPEHFVGLNFLECRPGQRRELERNNIIRDLAGIFQALYGNVPESMGPAFLLYMRNAVALLMEDPSRSATLVDLPRVFADTSYRNYLLAHCQDDGVREFWEGIASRTSGDSGLGNMAPYIVNKFTEFTQNDLVRLVVGQSSSTINLRSIMDQKKILLVNLSKGLLNDADTKFIGMILTGRLFAAATSRASIDESRRVPFYVYIDEFQNFTTSSLGPILAEARKYALSVTLAHQNLAQLPSALSEAILANTGSRIFMRVGSPDAHALAQYVSPHFAEQDLVTLPDLHAIARIKVSNAPSMPFLMHTTIGRPPLPSSADKERVESIAKQSQERYCVEGAAVRRQIELRRSAYLLKFTLRAGGIDGPLHEFLHSLGLKTLADIVSHLPRDAARMRELATTLPMRTLLDRLERVRVLQSQGGGQTPAR